MEANLNVYSIKDKSKKLFLFEIAYINKDIPILNFFMDLIHSTQISKDKQLPSVLKSFKNSEVIFNETQKYMTSAKILLDT